MLNKIESPAKRLINTYEFLFHQARVRLDNLPKIYRFEEGAQQKSLVTNMVEHLNREFRRWSNIEGVFPTRASYIQFITTYMMEYEEECQTERARVQSLTVHKLRLEEAA